MEDGKIYGSENRRKLYDNLTKDGFDLGSLEDFNRNMDDKNTRHAIYEAAQGAGWEVPEYDQFDRDMTVRRLKIGGETQEVDHATYDDFMKRHPSGTNVKPKPQQPSVQSKPQQAPSAPVSQAPATVSAPETPKDPVSNNPWVDQDGRVHGNVFTNDPKPEVRKDATRFGIPFKPEAHMTAAQFDEARRQNDFTARQIKREEEEERRRNQPLVDTGSPEANKTVIKTQGEWDDDLKKGASRISNSVVVPAVDKAISEFDKKAHEVFEGTRKDANGGGLPTGTASGATIFGSIKESNKAKDPEKILDYLKQQMEGLYNDQSFIDEIGKEADRMGIDRGEYLEQVIKPQIMSDLSSRFDNAMIARELPKSGKEYVVNGLGDSIVGMLADTFLKTKSQRAYKNQAAAMTENGQNPYYNPRTGAKLAKIGVTFAADAPFFGVSGKVGGMAAKNLAERQIKNLLAKGLSENAARSIVGTALENSVGARMKNYIMQHVVSSSITMGGFNAMSEGTRQIRDDEFDPGALAGSTVEGLATGAAFGLTGGAVQALSQPLSGIAKVGAKVGGFGAEAETMYATEELAKMAQGEEGFENPFEGSVEALMKLGVMKVSSPGGLMKGLGEIAHPLKSNQRQRTGVDFTEDEQNYIRSSAEGKSLVEALGGMHPELAISEVNGKKSLTPEGEQMRRQLSDSYNAFMSNPEYPATLKQKVAHMLGGVYRPGLETGADIIHNADGSVLLKTRDKDGNCVRDIRFDSFSDAEQWRETCEDEFRLNDAVNGWNATDDSHRAAAVEEVAENLGISWAEAKDMVYKALDAKDTSLDRDQYNMIFDAVNRNAYPADEYNPKRRFEEGRKISPEERHFAMVDAQLSEERLALYGQDFADEVIGAAEYPDEKIAELATRSDISGEQLEAAKEYYNNAARLQGMMEETMKGIDEQVEAANAEIRRNTHPDSGALITGTYNGRNYYVTAGHFNITPEGKLVSTDNTGAVIVRDVNTGEIEVLNPNDVTLTAINDPRRMIEANDSMDGLRGELMKQADDSIELAPGTPEMPEENGEVFTGADGKQYIAVQTADETGNPVWAKVELDGDGNPVGEPQALDIEEYRKSKSNEIDAASRPQEEVLEQPVSVENVQNSPENVQISPENAQNAENNAQISPENIREAQQPASRIPVDKKGKKVYEQASPEDTLAELTEKYGEEKAQRMISQIAESTVRELEKLQQEDTSSITDMADLVAHEDALAEAQRKAEYWQGLLPKDNVAEVETVPEAKQEIETPAQDVTPEVKPAEAVEPKPEPAPVTPVEPAAPTEPTASVPVEPEQPKTLSKQEKIFVGSANANIGRTFNFTDGRGIRSELTIDRINRDGQAVVTRRDFDELGNQVGEARQETYAATRVGEAIINNTWQKVKTYEERLRDAMKGKPGANNIINVLADEEIEKLWKAYEAGDKLSFNELYNEYRQNHFEDLIAQEQRNRTDSAERTLGYGTREDKLRRLRRLYQGNADAELALSDEMMQPQSLEEHVAGLLGDVPQNGTGQLAYYSYGDGTDAIVGLQDETGFGNRGVSGDTKGFNPWLAPKGKGMSLAKYAETLHSQLPEALQEQYTDQDVRNAIIEVLTSAEKPTDIPNMILRNRARMAEEAMRREEQDWIDSGIRYQKAPRDFAARLKRGIEQVNTEPSEAQKEAGNYMKGHVSFGGYDYTIENPAGSIRRGRDADGNEWEQKMNNTYGYILGKFGKDGDHLDMFINDKADLDDWNGNVYVVDQVNPKTGEFDEHKILYGFDSEAEARDAYLSNYSKGWKGLGDITGVPKEVFDKWLDSSTRKQKEFADHSIIKQHMVERTNRAFDSALKKIGEREISIDDPELLKEYGLKNVTLSKMGDYLTLTHFIAGEQGKGNGTRFMNDLARLADEKGWTLALTPDDSFGATSVKRLKDFYKRFGFVENRGRNTDFYTRESMLRRPKDYQPESPERREQMMREAVVSHLRQAGIEVSDDWKEGQRILDEYNSSGMVKKMGSRVDSKKADLSNELEDKDMDESQQAVADVYTGKKDNAVITVNRDGQDQAVTMRQGNENKAGTKHSLFRHYGTGLGVITADDVLRIPEVLANGERTEKQRGNVRLAQYRLTDESGKRYTVVTEIKNSGEVFNDFYTNKKASNQTPQMPNGDTPEGARTNDLNASDAKVQQNPETTKDSERKFFRTPDGQAYGYTYKGKIYLDPRIATSETPIHEYGHLWAEMKRQTSPDEWNEIKGVMLGDKLVQPIIDRVRRDYPELAKEGKEDDFVEEIITQFSGRRGAERLREIAQEIADENGGVFGKAEALTAMQRLKNILNRFWEGVARMMGWKYTNANQIADRILSDMLNGVNPRDPKSAASSRMRTQQEMERTLMGVHNLSEDKLRKVLKQGGLANPSLAVVDTKQHMHTDYGDISLIPRASMIDARTGRNAGTFTADAWTPSYPNVERRMTDKGYTKFRNDLRKLRLESGELANKMRMAFDTWLSHEIGEERLAYWYLKEKGLNPEDVLYKSPYSKEMTDRFDEITDNGKISLRELPDEQIKEIADMYHAYKESIGEPVTPAEERVRKMEERMDPNKKSPFLILRQQMLEDLRKYGESVSSLRDFVDGARRFAEADGKIDEDSTIRKATEALKEKNLQDDFKAWLEQKANDYGIEEWLYNGTDDQGRNKWVRNTLENASRLMRKEGLNGATDWSSLGSWIATVANKEKTLEGIRRNKKNLNTTLEEHETWKEQWGERLYPIVEKLGSGNPFHGDNIMKDILEHKDFAGYYKREYGRELTKDEIDTINTFIKEVRTSFPTGYFETKFERPVMLDEFEIAVVPETTSPDVVEALKNAGLDVRTYDASDYDRKDENRTKAAMEAVKGRDDIMFQKTETRDKEYADAVAAGDMEKVDAMLREEAARKGYSEDSDYQGTTAFNGAAPAKNDYFDTKEERRQAFEDGEYDGTASLGDFMDSGIDLGNLDWTIHDWRGFYTASPSGKESIINLRNAVDGKKKTIKMYRSVPSDIKENSFRNGDWVTPSREYAKENALLHGWGRKYRIIEQEVPVDDIWWDNNDINEWGYDDGKGYAYKNTRNNRKLMEPTYDENGNLIPLSQRFNEKKPDIRFQKVGGDDKMAKVVDMNSKFVKMPEKQIEELYHEGLLPGESLNMKDRVNNMSPRELVEQYERLNSQMLDENGLDVDQQEEAFRRKWAEEHGWPPKPGSGFGKASAEDFQRQIEKYTYNKMALRWDIKDRIEELGLEAYIDPDLKQYVSIDDLPEKETAEFIRMPGFRFQMVGKKGAEKADETESGSDRTRSLGVAKDAAKAGLDPKAIKFATGWEKGKDGKWRYEIPDADVDILSKYKAKYDEMKKDGVGKPQPIIKLGELLGEDNELFKYYPELKDMDVLFSETLPDGTAGVYDGANIELNAKETGRFDDADLNNENVYGTLLHEVQHAIQDIEGFAQGGSLQTSTTEAGIDAIIDKKERQRADIKTKLDANRRILDNTEELNQAAELDGKTEQEVKDKLQETVDQQAYEYDNLGLQIDRLRHTKSPAMSDARDLYQRLAGEVESRNVTERMKMTPEQRRNSLASETEDVPREDQVVINSKAKSENNSLKFQRSGNPEPEMTPEERQYWNKYDTDMKKWRERNAIPEGTDGPGEKPRFQQGESALDYAKRLVAYNREKALWQTAPKLEDYRQKREDKDMLEAARENEKRYPDSPSAKMRRVAAEFQQIRRAMSQQKAYDKATVKAVTDFAQEFMKQGFGDNLSRGEMERMLSSVKNATGAKDIRQQIDNIMDILVDNQLRNLDQRVQKLSSTRELSKTAQGVEKQGKLELKGQRMIQAFRQAREERMTPEKIRERMNEVSEKMTRNDDEAPMWEQEYEGLSIALQYAENIEGSREEFRDLDRAYKDAVESYKTSGRSYKAQQQLLESIDQARMENKIERIGLFGDIIGRLEGNIAESMEGAKEFVQREKDRVKHIQQIANFDLAGKDMGAMREKSKGRPANFFLQPLGTFEQMLKQFGSRNANGEGYLYDHFMRSWMDSTDQAYVNELKAKEELDSKAREVFGDKVKRWSDLYDIARSLPTMEVEVFDGEEPKTFRLNQGNLLYIYMADKMTDGRMKLRKMGIEEEDVQAIKDFLDPRLVELGDWLQDDYLVRKRTEYNKVHERMFGAPMAAIDHYFPLRILGDARVQEQDVNVPDAETLPSTITGNIIKRRKNALPLDILHTDALSLAIEHVEDMEKWAATAEWNRDINTLLSYTTFRNKVKNMDTIYGSGDALWENFKDAARMAAGTYMPKAKPGSVDATISNIAKGVTAAKISFRAYTAFKQILSAPAFLHDVNLADFAKYSVNPYGSWKWAMENMPVFKKRWKSRQVGDTRLMDDPTDWKLWKTNIVKMASMLGMSPNALVDGVTCAVGARAIYDARYRKYKKIGATDEVARKRALQDAEIGYNLTQQSSEGAFVSRIQKDRTVAANMLSVFRNSSMAYTRQWVDAARNLRKRTQKGYKEDSIKFMTRQFEEQFDLDEAQAKKAAEAEYALEGRRDVARMLNMMFGVTVAWNLGASLPYLLLGDDDETKKEMMTDALLRGFVAGPTEGFAAGNLWSELMSRSLASEQTRNTIRKEGWGAGVDEALKQGGDYEVNPLPLMADLQGMIKKMGYDKFAAAQDVFNIVAQSAVGVNPQTFTDMWNAIMDYAAPGWDGHSYYPDDENLTRPKELALFMMRLLNAPTSSWRNKYIDELGMNVEDAKKLPYEEMARRYAHYKHWKDAPIMGWLRGEEGRQAKMEKIRKQFDDAVMERMQRLSDDELKSNLFRSESTEEKRKYAKIAAERLGLTPASNGDSKKPDDKHWYQEFYQELMQYEDVKEDETLASKMKELRDDNARKEINKRLDWIRDGKYNTDSGRKGKHKKKEDEPELIAKGKKQLNENDGKDSEAIMKNIRQWRKEALEILLKAESEVK